MRLLIECTYVYEHPKINSGIQRVVRNIVRELNACEATADCIPVILKNNNIHQVLHFEPSWQKNLLFSARHYLQALHHRFWLSYEKVNQRNPFSKSRNLRRALYIAARLISLPLLVTLVSVRWIDSLYTNKIACTADDVLVLLDSSWHASSFAIAEKLQSQGVRIVAVVYDLIPITHPQFFDAGLSNMFQQWFDWAARTADGFMAISRTVATQTQQEIFQRLGAARVDKSWFDFFHLGSELDLMHATHSVRAQVIDAFADVVPVYLMVSTIEPRKNHSYLLDAFDLLWSQGATPKLCFVGKVGWKCEQLLKRIKTHPEFGKRLLIFNNLSDTELEYCYRRAKALVFSSHAEGFGLPLVEAMQRGLPAMASDIPVFREVGGDFAAYFDLADAASLTKLVQAFEQSGNFPALRPLAEWHWLNWHDAAQMLVAKVRLRCIETSDNNSLS